MAANLDHVESALLRDRYRGALVGLAVGDALGATVEFMSREQILEEYGIHREITGGGWLGLPPGEITDDTEMALCIAESLTRLGRFDADDIANRFLAWYRSNPRDVGNATRAVLGRMDTGLSWEEAAAETRRRLAPRDAGNGSLMRCAPVALFARQDEELNRSSSASSSRVTHMNPLAVECCVVYNLVLARLLDDPTLDVLETASAYAESQLIGDALGTIPTMDRADIDASGYVLSTFTAACWAVHRADSFEEAVILAVNLGGDADTTGAVAGALAGARWGLSSVPQRWSDTLICRDDLVSLADGLLALSIGILD
jgi:ADP-ribosyl-[dinitrogen reductase] hydrolase